MNFLDLALGEIFHVSTHGLGKSKCLLLVGISNQLDIFKQFLLQILLINTPAIWYHMLFEIIEVNIWKSLSHSYLLLELLGEFIMAMH